MLKNVNEDSILLFEYFTASGENNTDIKSEAESLILALIEDLKSFDIFLVMHKSYEYLVKDYKDINIIFIDENLEFWLNINSGHFKRAVFIAGENEMKLYKLTKILENNNVKIYNSDSNATLLCSNKFNTYNKLKNVVLQPETVKIQINSKEDWKNELISVFNNWKNSKIIIKPVNGIDCEGVSLISNLDDIINLKNDFPMNSFILVQKFIEGIDISVSLISDGNKTIPISLNKQNMTLTKGAENYLGGWLPHDSEYKEDIFNTSVEAVESIKGIKGFIGVDLILSEDKVYLIEINSRFTTPYAALQKIANFNIGESIINLLDNKIELNDLEKEVSFSGYVFFKKDENQLSMEILK